MCFGFEKYDARMDYGGLIRLTVRLMLGSMCLEPRVGYSDPWPVSLQYLQHSELLNTCVEMIQYRTKHSIHILNLLCST